MAITKIPSNKTTSTIDTLAYGVSSSVNGNMSLIQQQIKEKTNEYINIKNAVQILEKFSNWNGYIKLYTEVESNFDVGDIVYVTYTESGRPFEVFVLDNNYDNDTDRMYDDPYDDHIKNISFGYTVLYVNKYNNEVVINRRYNDINNENYKHCILKDQILSKVSCRDGNFFGDLSDGVAYYNCNFFNGDFGILKGYVSGATGSIPFIYCSGLYAECDSITGYYEINVPSGKHLIQCKVPTGGYVSQSVEFDVISNKINNLNLSLSSGTNSITISTFEGESICQGAIINFYSEVVGYDDYSTYQWKINGVPIGSNNKVFSYNNFNDNDEVSCEVSDDFDLLINEILGLSATTSNILTIQILTPVLLIGVLPSNNITYGDSVTFTAYNICISTLTYQWRVNEAIQYGVTGTTFTTSTLQDGDIVYCKIGTYSSNQIIMSVYS